MKKENCSEVEALTEVEGWRMGIVLQPVTKMMMIPKGTIIGLKRLGWLDLLQNKYGWLTRRIEK